MAGGAFDLDQESVQAFLTSTNDGMCRNCGKRPGTVQWVGEGGTMAYVHGMWSMWCERCTTSASLDYARKQAERIPDLEAALARLVEEDDY